MWRSAAAKDLEGLCRFQSVGTLFDDRQASRFVVTAMFPAPSAEPRFAFLVREFAHDILSENRKCHQEAGECMKRAPSTARKEPPIKLQVPALPTAKRIPRPTAPAPVFSTRNCAESPGGINISFCLVSFAICYLPAFRDRLAGRGPEQKALSRLRKLVRVPFRPPWFAQLHYSSLSAEMMGSCWEGNALQHRISHGLFQNDRKKKKTLTPSPSPPTRSRKSRRGLCLRRSTHNVSLGKMLITAHR